MDSLKKLDTYLYIISYKLVVISSPFPIINFHIVFLTQSGKPCFHKLIKRYYLFLQISAKVHSTSSFSPNCITCLVLRRDVGVLLNTLDQKELLSYFLDLETFFPFLKSSIYFLIIN
jgi:hypothetical protein